MPMCEPGKENDSGAITNTDPLKKVLKETYSICLTEADSVLMILGGC